MFVMEKRVAQNLACCRKRVPQRLPMVQGQGPLVDKLLSLQEWKDIFLCTISGAIVKQFDRSPVKRVVRVLFNLISIKLIWGWSVGTTQSPIYIHTNVYLLSYGIFTPNHPL